MKITRVQTLVLNLPMLIDGPTPMLGGRPRTSIDMLLVRIETDGGVVGWGEAFGHRVFPATRAIVDTLLGPMCVGRDPGQISAINDEAQRVLHGIGRNGSAQRPARVREPPTLWHGRCRRSLHPSGARARLSTDQAARDHRAGGEGGP